jgi:NAD(P)-dependent dehydrogenase (short-subunit alcohol dehydrogenase family)
VIACDVLDRENISSVVSDITSALAGDKDRPFVGVVNVAGFCMISPLELTAREDIERMFFPLLRANRGRVVNVGSVSGYAPVPGWGVYSGAKAGIENLTRAWALEVAPLGIRMTTVRPGIVASAAIGPKIQASIDGWRADEKAIGYDSLGNVLHVEPGANSADAMPYKTLLENNARNLELSMKGGTPAVNVAKTIRDALVCAMSEIPRK